MKLRRSIVLALGIATSAAAAAAVTVASGAPAPPPPAPELPTRAAAVPDHAAVAQAHAHVDALDSRRSADDAPPLRAAVSRLTADGLLDPLTTRRVEAGQEAGWLALTDDGEQICVVSEGALTCPTVEMLVDEGAAPGYVGREGSSVVHVFGVVSDMTTDVELLLRDRRTLSVTVRDNFFAVDVPAVPIELTWLSPTGARSWTFPARSGVGGVP